MPEYPVQISKVQAPPLREETLERVRLLDWLRVKVHRRVVLVIAEAGYGKTTLLADFTRRSRVRTLWFRLDRGDRDWAGIIAHLVAAVRIHLPDFAPVTRSLLRDIGGSGPPRDAVLDTFIRELGDLPNDPTALVLDDVHAVDDSIDVRHIFRELLARAPERLTFVLISRKVPPIPLARLRALGEVVELRTSDLRFDMGETEQLFRQTYALELEPSVVAELSRRTEGWAASLQLVRTAIRDRTASEIRAFVHSLSGAEGELYDYLAEEVIGELSSELQQFLMRTSILDTVEPILGGVAAEISPTEARAAIAEGELLGLFSRTGPQRRDRVRAHPLVRDFLQARLIRSLGTDTAVAIHRAVAKAAEPIDWRIASRHYLAAGDLDHARRILANSIDSILATGAYADAEALATALPQVGGPDPNVLVVLSRMAQQRGLPTEGLDLAEAAFAVQPSEPSVVLNLASARVQAGNIEGALDVVRALEDAPGLPRAGMLANAFRLMFDSSVAGDLAVASLAIETLIGHLRRQNELHFLGVSLTNLAYIRNAEGRSDAALEAASEAVIHLGDTSAGIELVAAHLARAWALVDRGDLEGARAEVEVAWKSAPAGQALEIALEAGELEVRYGDPLRARDLLDGCADIDPATDLGEQLTVLRIHTYLAMGRLENARPLYPLLRHGVPRSSVSFEARRFYAEALGLWLAGEGEAAVSAAAAARRIAEAQRSFLLGHAARLLAHVIQGQGIDHAISSAAVFNPSVISVAAEAIVPQLGELGSDAREIVSTEAQRRPSRWRPLLRRALDDPRPSTRFQAASLLDIIGTPEDVAGLRIAARTLRSHPGAALLGRTLARRLAPRVYVEDLGRVALRIGTRRVEGSNVRRKVLALLCYLVSRPDQSATRDEVLEALWPELPPDTALNSLNQTVYFLRRVFEPSFSEDLTAGYIGQDGETVWLDRDLIGALSQTCREMIRSMAPTPNPDAVLVLTRVYRGRFALDFMYEDWASSYRDSLHSSFLRVVEVAVRLDSDTGQHERGIEIAELVADVEPDSEDLQVALLRLYRMSRSYAAAAEQYGHYARSLRDLGVEPPPLSDL